MPAGSTGYITRLTLANISAPQQSLPAKYGMPSNYVGTAPGAGGTIAGVALLNVTVGGTCWSSATDAELVVTGAVSGVQFGGC